MIEVRETDETDSLLGTAANKRPLFPALEDVETGSAVMTPDHAAFQ
tara:strand:- start:555 stop:692 length:138 start_codon:yes stop_codon:yes gene_type:complete